MILRCNIISIVLLSLSFPLYSQVHSSNTAQKPELNKPMPDFSLDQVRYFQKSTLSLSDFKGKWLFLDFWYRGCSYCIKTFPKINSLQEKFKEKADFVLVGSNSKRSFGKDIEILYEKLRQKQNLTLAVAFDSTMEQKWDIWSYPHIIIIDPAGIVRFITDGTDLTEEKVTDLLSGKKVSFVEKNKVLPSFEPDLSADSDGNLLYRCESAKWNGEKQYIPTIYSYVTDGYIQEGRRPGIFISRAPLQALYNLAYFAKWQWLKNDSLYSEVYPYPILELKDTTLFDFDFKTGSGMYNFELTIPASINKAHHVMSIMQQELENCFRYKAHVESRMVLVWNLVSKPGASEKLRSKGGPPGDDHNMDGDGGAGGFAFKNYPVNVLLNRITRYISYNQPPCFDETGISHNIDISMDALMTDRAEVLKALQKNGLDLVLKKRMMKVLVIRDP